MDKFGGPFVADSSGCLELCRLGCPSYDGRAQGRMLFLLCRSDCGGPRVR
jgi:hypothetical protein